MICKAADWEVSRASALGSELKYYIGAHLELEFCNLLLDKGANSQLNCKVVI